MFDVYAYLDACREQGLSSEEALREMDKDRAEYATSLVEEIEERQLATAWQQDLIDMYRRER